tara:strand:- start:657 stop:1460 length:804 start_codon:yes stop_codon:yes gene_type:complete
MPRVTYADRLKAIITNPAVSPRDQGFAESLLGSYSRRGSLSSGRKRCLLQLEERYSEENLAKAAKNPLLKRLEVVTANVEAGSWDQGFVESLTDQTKSGRQLSEKQIGVLAKIEARCSPEALTAKSQWKKQYTASDDMRLNAKIVASYYIETGYYADLAHNILEVPEFVPTEKQYRGITGNKYAQKVLSAWFAEPKFTSGSYVYFRANAPGGVRRGQTRPSVVLKVNAAYPKTAAKGTKVYQVLPFGSAAPMFVEERYLKKARIGSA